MPPLGLITIAAMTPPEYECRLVDLNCRPLTDEDLAWADAVLFSAMLPQRTALFKAAQRCRAAGKLVIFGGPFPTSCPDECLPYADVLVLNEGEVTWPICLKDLETGTLQRLYTSPEKPDVTQTPCPRFDLLNLADYAIIPIQFSRGWPFQCEFCDIIVFWGRRPRTKTPAQLLRELDALYATGYRGSLFIVDDNFIGNKKEALKLLLEIKAWNQAHGRPFSYGTEASVNLADDPTLLRRMVEADFTWVFLGIETPDAASLKETHKFQNVPGSLTDRVKTIQQAGLVVYGGFIIGFDNDTEDIFDRQIAFITEAAIPNAMIGPLVALPGTPLYKRITEEGRLLTASDDQERTIASGYTNIRTTIPRRQLLEGHRHILQAIYGPDAYFRRAAEAFRRLPRPPSWRAKINDVRWLGSLNAQDIRTTTHRRRGAASSWWAHLVTIRRIFRQFPTEYRRAAWRFLGSIARARPEHLLRALWYVLMGYHFYKFTVEQMVPELDQAIAELAEAPRVAA